MIARVVKASTDHHCHLSACFIRDRCNFIPILRTGFELDTAESKFSDEK